MPYGKCLSHQNSCDKLHFLALNVTEIIMRAQQLENEVFLRTSKGRNYEENIIKLSHPLIFSYTKLVESCVTKIRQERNVVVILSALKNSKTNTTREFFASRAEGKIFMRRGNFFQFATKFWRYKGEKSFSEVGKFWFLHEKIKRKWCSNNLLDCEGKVER